MQLPWLSELLIIEDEKGRGAAYRGIARYGRVAAHTLPGDRSLALDAARSRRRKESWFDMQGQRLADEKAGAVCPGRLKGGLVVISPQANWQLPPVFRVHPLAQPTGQREMSRKMESVWNRYIDRGGRRNLGVRVFKRRWNVYRAFMQTPKPGETRGVADELHRLPSRIDHRNISRTTGSMFQMFHARGEPEGA